MISITPSLSIDDSDLHFDFIRSSGPGGQNVNKVATAVQLRFDLDAAAGLPEDVKQRVRRLARAYLTADGDLLIEAKRYRTQEQNRADALDRLVRLLRAAAQPPKPRRATHPSLASQVRRVEAKKRRGAIKRNRTTPPGDLD